MLLFIDPLVSSPILIAIFLMMIIAIIASLLRLLVRSNRVDELEEVASAYQAIPELLTPAERSFFGVLQQAVASDYQIYVKVRLADIVQPVPNPNGSVWWAAFNRIAKKHVDFVLCDSARMSVVAVIELDDRTHDRFDRKQRDGLVNAALADAHIPILRVLARQSYTPSQIQEQVERLLHSQRAGRE